MIELPAEVRSQASEPMQFRAHNPNRLDAERSRLHYRPDIDGLRAIAVLAVVAYHAFPGAVQGGFSGVDVFFVISGFLITLLLEGAAARGNASLAAFYSARIRRLFPALTVVLATVLIAGYYLLLAPEWRALGKHVAAGAGFLANFFYWSESGYFDTEAQLKPLLHLWSLGIEEQFYLAWPLLYWSIRSTGRARELTGLLFAISLTGCLVLVQNDAAAAFYAPATRAWELFSGALLAQHAIAHGTGTVSGSRTHCYSFGGLALVLVGFAVCDPDRPWPALSAMLPVAGTFALIAAGPSGWINRRLLAHPWVVGVGLISYPLYLWHWPLLAFLRISDPDPSAVALGATVLASFVLATLTYRFLERPVRERRARPVIWSVLMATLAGIGVGAATGAIGVRPVVAGLEKIASAPPEPPFPSPGYQPFVYRGSEFYALGTTSASNTTLYIGDSVYEFYYAPIERQWATAAATDRRVVMASSPGCPPFPGVVEKHRRKWCRGFMQAAFAYADEPGVDTVVLAAHWSLYFGNQAPGFEYAFADASGAEALAIDTPASRKAVDALRVAITRWRAQGKRVFVVLDIPSAEEFAPSRLLERSLWRGVQRGKDALDRGRLKDLLVPVETALREAGRSADAKVIDPFDTLCGPGSCPALTAEGEPRYRDASHLTAGFAWQNIHYLDESLE